MHSAKVAKWGNSQGIRIPAEIMREMRLNIGDQVNLDSLLPDKIVITLSQREKPQLKAAGILHRYAKGKPDLEAEQKAIEDAILEKYSKGRMS